MNPVPSNLGPLVSVVVPVRNEEKFLALCLRSLAEQSYPRDRLEILVVDGGSSDDSRQIVQNLMSKFYNLQLHDNTHMSTPSGMNLGIRMSRGAIIVIAGAHALYPGSFVQNCVNCLANTGAEVVGGPVITKSVSKTFGAQIACAILSSTFGVGNARFRSGGSEGFVDTVPFGAYRREVFDRVGLFNERLARNQDNDLSFRIRRAGGEIYFSPALAAIYFTADGYVDLLRQVFNKTQWHLRTLYENYRVFGYRHLAPAAFVILLFALGILSPKYTLARIVLISVLSLYFSAGALSCFHSLKKRSKIVNAILPLACFPFHLAYGMGTLLGVRHLPYMMKSAAINRDMVRRKQKCR